MLLNIDNIQDEDDKEPIIKKVDLNKIKPEKEKLASKSTLAMLLQKNKNLNVNNWIISEEDEDEFNNQIEEEREKWNQKLENSSNSFKLDEYEKKQSGYFGSENNVKIELSNKLEDAFDKFEQICFKQDKTSTLDIQTYISIFSSSKDKGKTSKSFHSSKGSI